MPTKQLRTWEDAVKVAARSYNRARPVDAATWAQEKEHVNSIIRSSRDLQNAIPDTIRQSILQTASMGLSLNPALQQCYLIPRKAKRNDPNSAIICYPSPSYRGLSKIAMDTGQIVQLRAEVVFKADKFKYRGPIEKPVHEPVVTDTHRTESQCIGAYAVAQYKTGDFYSCEFVDAHTINVIRRMSDNPNGPMYTTLWTEGWKKIAIRRLCKTLNVVSVQLTVANDVLNAYEGAEFKRRTSDDNDDVIEGEATVVDDGKPAEKITLDQSIVLTDLCNECGLATAKLCEAYGIPHVENLPSHLYDAATARVQSYKERKQA